MVVAEDRLRPVAGSTVGLEQVGGGGDRVVRQRLANAKNVGSLLARYRQIDQDVERLQTATMRAVEAWEAIVEDAVDRALDK